MTAPGISQAAPDGDPAQEAVSATPDNAEPPEPEDTAPARVAAGIADQDAGWRRLSRRSLVVRPLTDLVRLLPLLGGLLLLHARDGGGLVWGLAAAIFAVVTGMVHWFTTRYLITDERVYLRHGLLNQKRLSVARDRIRTVDVTAHLLHRMLGVCRITIGTGRNDYRSGESIHLDGLTRADADSLRTMLLAGPAVASPARPDGHAGPADSAPNGRADQAMTAQAGSANVVGALPGRPAGAAAEPATELAALRLRWLWFAPLTMTGLVVLGVLFGTVVQLTNDTNVNLARTGQVRLIIADYAAMSVVQRVLTGAAVAIAGYVLIAIIGYIAVYWNFRLEYVGADTVRVTRGLLSVRATTISRSRLRGVEISEPLLLRAARGARCTAIATGLRAGRGAEHEGSVLLPPAPRSVALAVAASVLAVPDYLCSGPLRRHGQAARRRRYIRALAGAAVIVLAICLATWARHGPAWVWIGSFALLPAACLLAADRYRSLGHQLSEGWLVTRTGSLSRRRSIIGTDAIIGWRIHQTWFQRRQGLMTLTATTAAGQQHYSVRDVPFDVGLAVASAATGGLVLPFLAGGRTAEPG